MICAFFLIHSLLKKMQKDHTSSSIRQKQAQAEAKQTQE
jgi:hypothetical protein